MVAPNSMRDAIIALHKKGKTTKEIVKTLDVARRTVQFTVKRYKELQSNKDRAGRGRKKTATSSRVVEIVRKRIKRNPRRSQRQMASDIGISPRSIGRIVKSRLNLYPYTPQICHALTDDMKQKRKERCKKLLSRFARGRHSSIVFSDEKLFTIDPVSNRQNDRILAASITDANKKGRIQGRTAHPQSVMVWGGITSTGKTPLVFVDAGVKINKDIYKKTILEDVLKPWSRSHFGQQHWCFQQDSAPAHKARLVQTWCGSELPDFITHEEWPSNSPDLNPLDFSVWSVMEKEACSTRHNNLASLKAALLKAWSELDDDYLRETCNAFVKRLKLCVAADGGHFE